MHLADQFWTDGFVIVRSVFRQDEVTKFREAALKRKDRIADLLSSEDLSCLLLDDRVLSIVRDLIGDEIVYFGDSSISIGPADAGFHKDNADKFDANGPDWHGRYPIVRMGLYTQSHARKPDGLDLRKGSHNYCSTRVGQHVYADTDVGDLVIWNLRTSHSGCGMTVFGRPIDPESIPGKLLRRMPLLRDKATTERVAIFATFGASGPHLDRYLSYLKTRKYAIDGWRASHYSAEALAAAKAKGVRVRDMAAEIAAAPPTVVNVRHVPIPY